MNLETAVAALRHLDDLPDLRRQELLKRATLATSDAARALLVLRARHEAQEGAQRHQEAIRQEFRDRYEWSVRNPPREPEPQVRPTPRAPDRPEVRPVTVTWTTPRKPDLIRPERHAEMHKGEERSRAQRELSAKPDLSNRRHGAPSTYNSGCRCSLCVESYRDYRRVRYAEKKKMTERQGEEE